MSNDHKEKSHAVIDVPMNTFYSVATTLAATLIRHTNYTGGVLNEKNVCFAYIFAAGHRLIPYALSLVRRRNY
jgi:hypothetical protein